MSLRGPDQRGGQKELALTREGKKKLVIHAVVRWERRRKPSPYAWRKTNFISASTKERISAAAVFQERREKVYEEKNLKKEI